MDLYVLDDLLRRETVVDQFLSLIWTERYATTGDFELKIVSNYQTKSLFTPNTYLAITDSYRVMIVETVSDDEADDGSRTLTITGPSIEDALDDRIAAGSLLSTTADHSWSLTGTPADIARQIFQQVCVVGKFSAGDIFPFVQPGSLFPPGTLLESTDVITLNLDPMTVLAAITNLCSTYGFGFRMLRNFDTSQLYFEIYTGNDLTTAQNNFDAVVFSPGLDNLSGITELNSTQNFKNVAIVVSPAAVVKVYAPGYDNTISGFNKHVLLVDASDVTAIGDESNALLAQRGLDALAQAKIVRAFDGQISQLAQYRYGIDYNLGDLVEMRDDQGSTTNMRVTEHIYISDDQGDRSYPTLAVETFVVSGTWDSTDYNETWDEAVGAWDSTAIVPPPLNIPPTPSFTVTRSTDRTTAAVDASSSVDPDGVVTAYSWDFGDGSTGSGITTSHTYTVTGTYTITLTLTDDDGAVATLSKTISVVITVVPGNAAPVASFIVSKSSDGVTVVVDATASSDSDGTIVSYAWDFGDGNTGTGVTTSHVYATSGTYVITLTVTDDDGAHGNTTKSVVIGTPPPANVAPTADFTVAKNADGKSISVNAGGSNDPDGTIVGYAWTFGDGGTATGINATHTYTASSTYTVTLTVTDDDGAHGSITKSVSIVLPTPPVADFTSSVGTDGRTVTFTAS